MQEFEDLEPVAHEGSCLIATADKNLEEGGKQSSTNDETDTDDEGTDDGTASV